MAAEPPAGEPLATHLEAEYLADMGEALNEGADEEFEACIEVWPQSELRGGAAGASERRLRWHSVRGAETCPAVAWRFGTRAADRSGTGWAQQAGALLDRSIEGRDKRVLAAGLGLAMEIYMGEHLLAAQQDLAVSSLVDVSAPGSWEAIRQGWDGHITVWASADTDTKPPYPILQPWTRLTSRLRGKGAQLAASLRFRVDIDDMPRYFRLLLLPAGVPLAEKAQAALPQEDRQRLADHLATLSKLRGKLLGLLVVEHCAATGTDKAQPGYAFRQSAADSQPADEADTPGKRTTSAAAAADDGAGPTGAAPGLAAPIRQQKQQLAPAAAGQTAADPRPAVPKTVPRADAMQPRAQPGAVRSRMLATSRQQQSSQEAAPDRLPVTGERLPAEAARGNGRSSGSVGGSGGIQVKAEPDHRPSGWSEHRLQDGSRPYPSEAGRQPAVSPEADRRRSGEQMLGDQHVSSRPKQQHRQLSAKQNSRSGHHHDNSASAQPAEMPDFISLAPAEGCADDGRTRGAAATATPPPTPTAAHLLPAGSPLMDFPPSPPPPPPPPLPPELDHGPSSLPPQPPAPPENAQLGSMDLPPHLMQLPPHQPQQQQLQQHLQLPPHLLQQQAPLQQVSQQQSPQLGHHIGRQQQQPAPQQHSMAPPAPLLQLAAAAEPSSPSDMQLSASDEGEWQGLPNDPGQPGAAPAGVHPGAARAWAPPDRDWSPPQGLQPPQPDAFRRQLRDMPPLGSSKPGSQPLGLQRQPGSQPHPHEQHTALQPAAQRPFWQAPPKLSGHDAGLAADGNAAGGGSTNGGGGSGYTVWGGAGCYVPHDQSVVPVVFRNFAHEYEERIVQALQHGQWRSWEALERECPPPPQLQLQSLCQFMMEKPRLSLIETSRDMSRMRLRPDAVARIQRKRSILDYLYLPLGSLRLEPRKPFGRMRALASDLKQFDNPVIDSRGLSFVEQLRAELSDDVALFKDGGASGDADVVEPRPPPDGYHTLRDSGGVVWPKHCVMAMRKCRYGLKCKWSHVTARHYP